MIAFLADMGVSQSVVAWLRDRGYDIVHLSDLGLQRLSDQEVFAKAVAEQRAILTFDLDFGEILAFSGEAVVSVVVFRLNDPRSSRVIERLDHVLRDVTTVLMAGAIVVIEEDRHRIRRLPLNPAGRE